MNPTINVHEYPEGADHRTLLQYKIEVMQAFLRGAALEARVNRVTPIDEGVLMALRRCGFACTTPLDGNWHPLTPVPGIGGPNFNWSHYDYRVAQPKARYFRPRGGLFRTFGEPERSYCIWFVGENARMLFTDGTSQPAGTVLSAALDVVRLGNWVEFDGDMTPWRKPAPAPHWTDKLPKEYAELAKKRRQEYVSRVGATDGMNDLTLCLSFVWNMTPEGDDFWYYLWLYLSGSGPLPPIPSAPKPKKLVPLTPETLPLPCVLRRADRNGHQRWVVTYVGPDGVFMGTGHDKTSIHSWKDLMEEFSYSTDHGKTWHPCSREEVAS